MTIIKDFNKDIINYDEVNKSIQYNGINKESIERFLGTLLNYKSVDDIILYGKCKGKEVTINESDYVVLDRNDILHVYKEEIFKRIYKLYKQEGKTHGRKS